MESHSNMTHALSQPAPEMWLFYQDRTIALLNKIGKRHSPSAEMVNLVRWNTGYRNPHSHTIGRSFLRMKTTWEESRGKDQLMYKDTKNLAGIPCHLPWTLQSRERTALPFPLYPPSLLVSWLSPPPCPHMAWLKVMFTVDSPDVSASSYTPLHIYNKSSPLPYLEEVMSCFYFFFHSPSTMTSGHQYTPYIYC